MDDESSNDPANPTARDGSDPVDAVDDREGLDVNHARSHTTKTPLKSHLLSLLRPSIPRSFISSRKQKRAQREETIRRVRAGEKMHEEREKVTVRRKRHRYQREKVEWVMPQSVSTRSRLLFQRRKRD
jgi:hypothetical protein